MENKVVTRFAPSPTGNLHSGSYRTAIFSYLYARQHGGIFVLRIEDTDKERSKKEYEENILESLKWLGLEYDVFVRQSENAGRHKEILEKMIKDGLAYISSEEAKDGSGVLKELVRFKNPNIEVSFQDEIKGKITMNTEDLGDFVIAKNINEPLFHLAVVVDDFDEGITHVIRGEDHVSNTPRQILIQRAIGAPTPIYAHLPLVLGTDKQKLSKRKGALAMTEYRDLGYLPEALLNMVSMIGWNPGTEQEIFSKADLIKQFSLPKIQKSPAIFNPEKLDWINKEHMKILLPEELKNKILEYLPPEMHGNEKIIPIIFDHISKFGDIKEMVRAGELAYYFSRPEFDRDLMIWKSLKENPEKYQITKNHLGQCLEILQRIDGELTVELIKEKLWTYADQNGRGEVLWPMRYALSGKEKSPDPFTLIYILGLKESTERLKIAIDKLG